MTQTGSGAAQQQAPRWLHHSLRAIALALAAVHTAVAILQQSMNEDGISYLDLGDAYLNGDWNAVVNGIWSPVYAGLIAAAVRIADPSVWWEFPTVQFVNFLVYVVALFSFGYFWRQLTAVYYAGVGDGTVRFAPALWWVLGYSLFIWVSLDLITLWSVSPDMSVAAVVYLAAGWMLRTFGKPATYRTMMAGGALLGFGYLVKAALLPLGLVAVLLTALGSAGPPLARAGRFLVAVFAMLLVSAPLIAALSRSAGHLTMGDVGRFAYLKHVNEMPYPDFHGAIDRLAGTPVHPPRRIYDEPPVYEFAQPVAGTYPMAYDPGYWTEGLEPTVTVTGQLRALTTSGMTWFELFVRKQGGFLAVVLLLGWMGIHRGFREWRLDGSTQLLLWSLSAFGLYSLLHVVPRYIAPFLVLFWAGILLRLRFPGDSSSRKLAAAGALLLSLFVWLNLAALHSDGLRRVTGFTPLDESAQQPGTDFGEHLADHSVIAGELMQLGLEPGDRIGVIGYAYSAYWARLARLRIVAEIHSHDQERFWNATASTRAEVLDALAAAGAVAVIAEPVPTEPLQGWVDIGDTRYLFHSLRR